MEMIEELKNTELKKAMNEFIIGYQMVNVSILAVAVLTAIFEYSRWWIVLFIAMNIGFMFMATKPIRSHKKEVNKK